MLQQLFTGDMLRALGTLSVRHQQALIMVYIENRPYPQVASTLGLQHPRSAKARPPGPSRHARRTHRAAPRSTSRRSTGPARNCPQLLVVPT